jgi:hypothetical protein
MKELPIIHRKAFPIANMEGDEEFLGMDLRDWFAGQALKGLLSSIGNWTSGLPSHEFSESVAHDAYWIADAMLKAREQVND